MAFPSVDATNTSSEESTNSHTVSLPASIVSGDLLIVMFAVPGQNEAIGWPAGWTEFFNFVNNNEFAYAYRQADGGEGASITVTTTNSVRSAHNSYRISGHEDPATQVPETGTEGLGNNTSPNPGSLTPTGGAKDYLWLASCYSSGSAINTAPSSYTNLLAINNPSIGMGSARKLLNAASEDPGAFTIVSSQWVAVVVAVHPVAVAAIASQRLKVGHGR